MREYRNADLRACDEQEIAAAVLELTPNRREVFERYYGQEPASIASVAESLGKSPTTVGIMLSGAENTLVKLIKPRRKRLMQSINQ